VSACSDVDCPYCRGAPASTSTGRNLILMRGREPGVEPRGNNEQPCSGLICSSRLAGPVIESLHGLIDEIQWQHSPELRSFAVNEVNLTGYNDEHNMLQTMISLKKRQGVEIGLEQITGLTLAFFIGNSTLSTDLGHEYKWCPASNRIGVTSCGVTQITKATSWWQTSLSKARLGANFDTDGTLIMTSSNCATVKRLTYIHHELGRQDWIYSQAKKSSLQPPRAHFLTSRPHFLGRRDWAG